MMTIGEERLANGVLAQLRRIADQLEMRNAERTNGVSYECENCGRSLSVPERAIVYVCPHCGTMARVCQNCHHWDPDMNCDKCPFVMGRED